MTAYTTTNPGDIRRRTRYIGIWTPGDERTFAEIAANPAGAPKPSIEVLEQDFVRLADREKKLTDLGSVPVGAFDPSESFPVRDPTTDELIPGATATVGQAMALIYSWVRAKQTARDNPPAPAPEPTP
jgi:hypothetical protein